MTTEGAEDDSGPGDPADPPDDGSTGTDSDTLEAEPATTDDTSIPGDATGATDSAPDDEADSGGDGRDAGGDAPGETSPGRDPEDAVASAIDHLRRDVVLGTAGALVGTIALFVIDAGSGAGALAALGELVGAGPASRVGAAVFFATGALAWSALFSSGRPYLSVDRAIAALGLAVVLWIGVVAALALVVPGAVASLPLAAVATLVGFGVYGLVLGVDYDRLAGRIRRTWPA